MSEAVDLNIQAGVPYARRIRVTDGKDIWAAVDDFEVRSQIRAGRSSSTILRYDLGQHLTSAIDGNDITVDLSLTGAETRALPTGYYDIFLSDPGATDARAIRVLFGAVKINAATTSAEDE